MTLKGLERYVDMLRGGRVKNSAITEIAISLTNNLWQYVFTDKLAQVFDVPDVATMRRYIKQKLLFPPLSRYSQAYFERMLREGKKSHGSLRDSTFIEIKRNGVDFYIPSSATIKTRTTQAGKTHTYDIGPKHERDKSILKATVVIAWQDLLSRIGRTYKKYAEMV